MSYRYRPSNYDTTSHISASGTSAMSAVWFLTGAFCSYMINKSVMWAIIHGFFGFLYIVYLCFGCGGGFGSVESGVEHFFGGERSEQITPARPVPAENTDSQADSPQ